MTSFEEADVSGNGAIEKPEWEALVLDDKRRRIEDEVWLLSILCLWLAWYLSLWELLI